MSGAALFVLLLTQFFVNQVAYNALLPKPEPTKRNCTIAVISTQLRTTTRVWLHESHSLHTLPLEIISFPRFSVALIPECLLPFTKSLPQDAKALFEICQYAFKKLVVLLQGRYSPGLQGDVAL